VLDVAFNEDVCRVRRDHGAHNLAILRRIALNLLKQERGVKVGLKNKRRQAGWSTRHLEIVLGLKARRVPGAGCASLLLPHFWVFPSCNRPDTGTDTGAAARTCDLYSDAPSAASSAAFSHQDLRKLFNRNQLDTHWNSMVAYGSPLSSA